jgi:hypothetical protein
MKITVVAAIGIAVGVIVTILLFSRALNQPKPSSPPAAIQEGLTFNEANIAD